MDNSNTNYFHVCATFHMKMNVIPSLCSMAGEERLWIIKKDYVTWLKITFMRDDMIMLYLNILCGMIFLNAHIGHNPSYSW